MSALNIKNGLCLDFSESQFSLGETIYYNANLWLLPYLPVLRVQRTDDVTSDEKHHGPLIYTEYKLLIN